MSNTINSSAFQSHSTSFNTALGEKYVIFFIGDFTVSACQHQLIDVIFALKAKGISNIVLVLMGKIVDNQYKNFVEKHLYFMDVSNEIIIIEDIVDLYIDTLYLRADLYLSLEENSERNQWLTRAIENNIPTIFYDFNQLSKNKTQEGKLTFKAPMHVATIIKQVMENANFRKMLLLNQYRIFFPEDKITRLDFRIDGPCDSTYSLALVNQELGLSLIKKRKKIGFFATEGPGDYLPNKSFLSKYKTILSHLTEVQTKSKVVIRNLYPPRVSKMGGMLNILGPYGWEESAFPQEYVQNFNRRLSGIACMSSYVEEVLKNNGVTVPLYVTGIGVDHVLRYPPETLPFELPLNLKLLHISSCFPRKGVDTLLKAFEIIPQSLSLIIKTFPNPHNTLKEDLRQEGWTEIAINYYVKADKTLVLIEEDLTMGQIRFLYESCDILVAPSRGEGFGLPMAEAMLLGLPVVTTGYGGQTDFCTADTSWLVDYIFVPAKTHMKLPNSLWAEPIISDLVRQIIACLNAPIIEKEKKIEAAKRMIQTHFKWSDIAKKLIDFQKKLISHKF